MVEWHHRLNGHEFEQTLGDGEGQGSLASCSPWGRKESDTTSQLNNSKYLNMISLVAQMVKCLLVRQETWVRYLGWEDPLEQGMAMHSSFLAWRIPWIEEPGGLQSDMTQRLALSLSLQCLSQHSKAVKKFRIRKNAIHYL